MSKDLVAGDGRNSGMGQFLVYESENGQVKIDVRLEGETVWLTQQLMAELFQSSQQNISHHIRCIYEEGELDSGATHKKYLLVRPEGDREVKRQLDYYNLVEQYLIFAEGQAMRRTPMHMVDWIKKLDAFLRLNEHDILAHSGAISHEMAKELVEGEYEKFNRKRIRLKDRIDGDFEKTIKRLAVGKRGKN